MSFDAHLIHSCTIQRASQTLDAYKNAVLSWADVAASVPCRLVEKQQRLVNTEKVESTVVTSHMLLVGDGADLLERDRVSSVKLEDGSLVTKMFVVKSLVMRRGRALRHKSAALEVVE